MLIVYIQTNGNVIISQKIPRRFSEKTAGSGLRVISPTPASQEVGGEGDDPSGQSLAGLVRLGDGWGLGRCLVRLTVLIRPPASLSPLRVYQGGADVVRLQHGHHQHVHECPHQADDPHLLRGVC